MENNSNKNGQKSTSHDVKNSQKMQHLMVLCKDENGRKRINPRASTSSAVSLTDDETPSNELKDIRNFQKFTDKKKSKISFKNGSKVIDISPIPTEDFITAGETSTSKTSSRFSFLLRLRKKSKQSSRQSSKSKKSSKSKFKSFVSSIKKIVSKKSIANKNDTSNKTESQELTKSSHSWLERRQQKIDNLYNIAKKKLSVASIKSISSIAGKIIKGELKKSEANIETLFDRKNLHTQLVSPQSKAVVLWCKSCRTWKKLAMKGSKPKKKKEKGEKEKGEKEKGDKKKGAKETYDPGEGTSQEPKKKKKKSLFSFWPWKKSKKGKKRKDSKIEDLFRSSLKDIDSKPSEPKKIGAGEDRIAKKTSLPTIRVICSKDKQLIPPLEVVRGASTPCVNQHGKKCEKNLQNIKNLVNIFKDMSRRATPQQIKKMYEALKEHMGLIGCECELNLSESKLDLLELEIGISKASCARNKFGKLCEKNIVEIHELLKYFINTAESVDEKDLNKLYEQVREQLLRVLCECLSSQDDFFQRDESISDTTRKKSSELKLMYVRVPKKKKRHHAKLPKTQLFEEFVEGFKRTHPKIDEEMIDRVKNKYTREDRRERSKSECRVISSLLPPRLSKSESSTPSVSTKASLSTASMRFPSPKNMQMMNEFVERFKQTHSRIDEDMIDRVKNKYTREVTKERPKSESRVISLLSPLRLSKSESSTPSASTEASLHTACKCMRFPCPKNMQMMNEFVERFRVEHPEISDRKINFLYEKYKRKIKILGCQCDFPFSKEKIDTVSWITPKDLDKIKYQMRKLVKKHACECIHETTRTPKVQHPTDFNKITELVKKLYQEEKTPFKEDNNFKLVRKPYQEKKTVSEEEKIFELAKKPYQEKTTVSEEQKTFELVKKPYQEEIKVSEKENILKFAKKPYQEEKTLFKEENIFRSLTTELMQDPSLAKKMKTIEVDVSSPKLSKLNTISQESSPEVIIRKTREILRIYDDFQYEMTITRQYAPEEDQKRTWGFYERVIAPVIKVKDALYNKKNKKIKEDKQKKLANAKSINFMDCVRKAWESNKIENKKPEPSILRKLWNFLPSIYLLGPAPGSKKEPKKQKEKKKEKTKSPYQTPEGSISSGTSKRSKDESSEVIEDQSTLLKVTDYDSQFVVPRKHKPVSTDSSYSSVNTLESEKELNKTTSINSSSEEREISSILTSTSTESKESTNHSEATSSRSLPKSKGTKKRLKVTATSTESEEPLKHSKSTSTRSLFKFEELEKHLKVTATSTESEEPLKRSKITSTRSIRESELLKKHSKVTATSELKEPSKHSQVTSTTSILESEELKKHSKVTATSELKEPSKHSQVTSTTSILESEELKKYSKVTATSELEKPSTHSEVTSTGSIPQPEKLKTHSKETFISKSMEPLNHSKATSISNFGPKDFSSRPKLIDKSVEALSLLQKKLSVKKTKVQVVDVNTSAIVLQSPVEKSETISIASPGGDSEIISVLSPEKESENFSTASPKTLDSQDKTLSISKEESVESKHCPCDYADIRCNLVEKIKDLILADVERYIEMLDEHQNSTDEVIKEIRDTIKKHVCICSEEKEATLKQPESTMAKPINEVDENLLKQLKEAILDGFCKCDDQSINDIETLLALKSIQQNKNSAGQVSTYFTADNCETINSDCQCETKEIKEHVGKMQVGVTWTCTGAIKKMLEEQKLKQKVLGNRLNIRMKIINTEKNKHKSIRVFRSSSKLNDGKKFYKKDDETKSIQEKSVVSSLLSYYEGDSIDQSNSRSKSKKSNFTASTSVGTKSTGSSRERGSLFDHSSFGISTSHSKEVSDFNFSVIDLKTPNKKHHNNRHSDLSRESK